MNRTALSLLLVGVLVAAAPAADQVFETQVKLKTPRSQKDKRAKGPADAAEFKLWLPDGVKKIRGVTYNPFYLDAVGQKHWQAACRLWGFGILAGNQFGVKKDEHGDTPLAALRQFAKQTGHPELANVPLCPLGMSAGGGMAVNFTALAPERVLAVGPVCLEVGPRNEASFGIPILTIFGERDGKQLEKLAESLPEARKQGAQFATAVQWRRRHEFGQANNLLFVLFDHVQPLRYPDSLDPAKGPIKLNPCKLEAGWLGDPATWDQPEPTIAAYDRYKGDKSKACWFPDSYVAHTWQAFVIKEPQVKLKSPPGLGDGQPFGVLEAGKPIEVKATVAKDLLVKKLELFDGDKSIGTISEGSAEVKLAKGIHALIVVATLKDGSRRLSRPSTVVVH